MKVFLMEIPAIYTPVRANSLSYKIVAKESKFD